MNNTFRIICDEEDMRLDVLLSERLSLTRTKVKDMIERGYVRIAGRSPKPSLKVKKSMEVEGEIPEEEPLTIVAQAIPLDIIYEDNYLLAINKPAGMVVHPSFGHSEGTLVNAVLGYLGQRCEEQGARNEESKTTLNAERRTLNAEPAGSAIRPGIVHRLDKGTTGVIIVAKDTKTQEMLSDLFKERRVRKVYLAIVEGAPKDEEWTVEENIGRHPVERKKMAVLKGKGRSALTRFKVLERLNGFAYIEACPRTGRTHQIRVHLACSGHSIVGDELYGKRSKRLAGRPFLHAWRIEFAHPVSKEPVSIQAAVPEDMLEFIESAKRKS
ncbi:MAG TPA: RluA family pseudouridine synthase [Syntrophorhabdaceae bacterium]|nr:RluA family pseudouridine synthase [Syntrophorhabdaceae bacterium]HQM80215.1 RluA family pseudouridine synthase [Syntrophorhabdaceae bacterium]